jgi:hypothetical protein
VRPSITPLRRVNPVASYPTPISAPRPSRELTAKRLAPVTPTRSGSYREAGPSQFELDSSPVVPNRALNLRQGAEEKADDRSSDTMSEGPNRDAAVERDAEAEYLDDMDDDDGDEEFEILLIEIIELQERLKDARQNNDKQKNLIMNLGAQQRQNANTIQGMGQRLAESNNTVSLVVPLYTPRLTVSNLPLDRDDGAAAH